MCACIGTYNSKFMPWCSIVLKLPVMLQYKWLAVGKLSTHCLHVHARCLWRSHQFSAVRYTVMHSMMYWAALASLNAAMYFFML